MIVLDLGQKPSPTASTFLVYVSDDLAVKASSRRRGGGLLARIGTTDYEHDAGGIDRPILRADSAPLPSHGCQQAEAW
jgi:hypothetical protein